MKRALVLGAGGFLGSHLTRRFVSIGWDVTAVVHDVSAPHVATRLADVWTDVRVVEGDAFDPVLLAELVPATDVVAPLAGRSGAARSLVEPTADGASNAVGQLAVLEAIRHHNPEARTFFPGSRLQYGRAAYLPVTESHPQEPTSIYGLHKMVGERYHLLYHQLYGIRTTSLRISNPYGPHQDRPDRAFGIVGNFLATASAGGALPLFGGGLQLRDYLYIDDVIDLILLALQHEGAIGEAFNASGLAATSLRDMAQTVVDVVGSGTIVDAPWPAAEGAVETGDYVGDPGKARQVLGWAPATSLTDGLTRTLAALVPSSAAAG